MHAKCVLPLNYTQYTLVPKIFPQKRITEREKRKDEQDGVEYHFVKENSLYETTTGMKDGYWIKQLGGKIYGYTRESINDFLKCENSIMHIQSDLALMVKRDYPDVILIFLDFEDCDSMSNKIRELVGNDSEYKLRLEYSKEERKNAYKFDVYMKSNDPYVLLYKIKRLYDDKIPNTHKSDISEKLIYETAWNIFLEYENQRIRYMGLYFLLLLISILIEVLCINIDCYEIGVCVSILIMMITLIFYQLVFTKQSQIKYLQCIIQMIEDKIDFCNNGEYIEKIKLSYKQTENNNYFYSISLFEILLIYIFMISIGLFIYFVKALF